VCIFGIAHATNRTSGPSSPLSTLLNQRYVELGLGVPTPIPRFRFCSAISGPYLHCCCLDVEPRMAWHIPNTAISSGTTPTIRTIQTPHFLFWPQWEFSWVFWSCHRGRKMFVYQFPCRRHFHFS